MTCAKGSALIARCGVALAGLGLATACGSTVQGARAVDAGLTAPNSTSSPATSGPLATNPAATGIGPDAASVGTASLGRASSGGAASLSGAAYGAVAAGSGSINTANRPVKVGILLTTIGQADALGLNVGNTYSEQQVDDAVINALNKMGGLNGHRIIPVYAKTNTASSNWDSDFQAACATFTQDNHVDVVLGSDFAFEQDFENCLTKAGIPHLSNTSAVPNQNEMRRYPLLRALIVPTVERRSIEQVQGAINAGFLTPSNKLGVITDDCTGSQWAWANVVKPFLDQHHITVAATGDEGCATGYNDTFSAAGANVSNAVLTFRSKGVDRITYVTVSETGPLLAMQEEASSQHYYPGWIVNSLVGTATLQSQAPADQMKNTRVYGWAPFVDVAPAQFDPPNDAQRRCLSLLRSQDIRPASAADFAYSYSVCEAMFVYHAAIADSGGAMTGVALAQGVDRLGTSLHSVVDLKGAADYAPSRLNDVPQVYRELVWHDSCSCFGYVGPTYPMP